MEEKRIIQIGRSTNQKLGYKRFAVLANDIFIQVFATYKLASKFANCLAEGNADWFNYKIEICSTQMSSFDRRITRNESFYINNDFECIETITT